MITGLIILITTFVLLGFCQVVRSFIYPSNGALFFAVAAVPCILLLPFDTELAHGFKVPTIIESKDEMTILIVRSNTSKEQRPYSVVLICDTPEARITGLQGFRRLKRDEAALFVFDAPEIVTFWMGNVAYTIDIIFVGSDKKVIQVFKNCKPGSHDLYSSAREVRWVIETAAGSGIKTGDQLIIELVKKP
ncbi:MAG TPA: DUF192 domain-containing protein [Nitrospirota bacterium]|nr:DUF192 domain-containing protein [Nitrospirota bacterium]